MPAILIFGQPRKIKLTIPTKQNTLQIEAMIDAPLGSILKRLTMKPPMMMPKQAPGIAIPPV